MCFCFWTPPKRGTLAGVKPGSSATAAADAEKVFREDLDRNPRNPRSLFGLQQALKAQKRDYDAGFVEKQFQVSWKGGKSQLKLTDLV